VGGGCKGGDAGFPQMLRAAAVNISLRSKHAHTSYKADAVANPSIEHTSSHMAPEQFQFMVSKRSGKPVY
jgi:hypothetical protein